jgi:Tol biopolymer transport system component
VRLALAPQSRVRQRVEDGAEVRTHLAEGAALSPDGRRIAFTALGALYIADAQGVAPPRKLFDGNAFQPAWSPDGRSLAFALDRRAGRRNLDDRRRRRRRTAGPQGAYWSEPLWDRDGKA